MPLVVYFDEVGNPTLDASDKDFPVFAIALFISEQDAYVNGVIPRVHDLKFKHWGHEGVILHSRDIRKRLRDFAFLNDPERRKVFIDDINTLMTTCDYRLIAVAIRKAKHKAQYVYQIDPYDLALLFAMERLVSVLEAAHQKEVTIIAERRGQKEDQALGAAFQRIITRGSGYVSAERFAKIRFTLRFLPKSLNIVGTQMADLAAYPLARRALDPEKPNPAYQIVSKKLCRMFKIFP